MTNNYIDNLVELIEEGQNCTKSLEQRAARIGEFKGYGPPDMCYFVREERGGLFSNAKRAGYYHYVYGADTSSSATVAAYMNDTLRGCPAEYSLIHIYIACGHRNRRSGSSGQSSAYTTSLGAGM